LIFSACPTEDESKPNFKGKWVGSIYERYDWGISWGSRTLEIFDTIYTLQERYTDWADRWNTDDKNGTWTYNGDTIKLIPEGRSGYYIARLSSDDNLILELHGYSELYVYHLSRVKPEIPEVKNSSLLINNLSDFNFFQVEYNAVNFGTINSGKDVTKDVDSGTKYIFFVIQTSNGNIRCRTEAITCEENKKNEFTFTNNTIVTVTITEDRDTLRNIYNKNNVP
jgi:hypothetical protein